LRRIKSFFNNAGTITIKERGLNQKICRYTVVDLNSILNVIIPHFFKYPLQSAKVIDFNFFKESAYLMKDKKHLTEKGLNQIVALKGVMNKYLSATIKEAFPNHQPLIRPSFFNISSKSDKLEPYWCTGFIEGDGSFYVKTKPSKSTALVYTVVVMSIGLDIREEFLLKKINNFFGAGNVYSYESKRVVEFKVSRLEDINSIIKHFTEFKLIGFKSYNFNIFKEIVELVNQKKHFTKEGNLKIQSLKNKLNVWS
jgi:hypothetical protein